MKQIPTEHQMQCAVIDYCRAKGGVYAMIYAIPNAGKRSPAAAAYYRAEGMLPGMPDLCLPVARAGYHALYIEMKRGNAGKLTGAQHECLRALTDQGNRAIVCRSVEEALSAIDVYLDGRTAEQIAHLEWEDPTLCSQSNYATSVPSSST